MYLESGAGLEEEETLLNVQLLRLGLKTYTTQQVVHQKGRYKYILLNTFYITYKLPLKKFPIW